MQGIIDSGIESIIINEWIDNPYIGTDGVIELVSKVILFHSAAVASISPNCKHHFLEFVIFSNWGSIFNTYMISPHYHLFPYSSQHQYQKKFTNFTSQNDSHSDIFLVSKYTKPPIYLLMIGTRRHVQKLILFLNRIHFWFLVYLLITKMICLV